MAISTLGIPAQVVMAPLNESLPCSQIETRCRSGAAARDKCRRRTRL